MKCLNRPFGRVAVCDWVKVSPPGAYRGYLARATGVG